MFRPCVYFMVCFFAGAVAFAGPLYKTQGLCGGYPKIPLTLAKGFCVGLVDDTLKFPRGVLPLPNGDVWVADMGSWEENQGRIWRYPAQNTQRLGTKMQVFAGLDRPHGLALGPDGWVYIGVADGVKRFNPTINAPVLETVLAKLPKEGQHPLKNIVFTKQGDLLLSLGSASDNCEQDAGQLKCQEAEGTAARGVVMRYAFDWKTRKIKQGSIYASGLRNPMAMATHSTGTLFVADNSRDAIAKKRPDLNDDDYPHERLLHLQQGKYYGWPYCFDNTRASPEFPKAKCAQYGKALQLLPAHAAPLSLAYAPSFAPNSLKNTVLIAYHGYRAKGHRIMFWQVDARGYPTGAAKTLLAGWQAKKGVQPLGAPVDIKFAADGVLYITEDRNKTLLRLVWQP